jgi:hypothetical protein
MLALPRPGAIQQLNPLSPKSPEAGVKSSMSGVSVSCPKCNASLKLPDRSLLGRKGKCPKCQHRFTLTAPAAESQTAATQSAAQAPLVGTSPRWIPDEPSTTAEPAMPVFSLAGQSTASPTREPAPTAIDTQPEPAVSSPAFDFSSPENAATSTNQSTASTVSRMTRRRKKSLLPAILTGITTAIVAGIVFGAVMMNGQHAADTETKLPPAVNQEWVQEKAVAASSNEQAVALSPTDGKPIPLNYIPFTPHLIFHLRPAELWHRDRDLAEFQANLSDLSVWLKLRIQTMTHFEPEEIEELTFAVNFGPRTSTPEIAAVVRLREKQTQSDLFRRFNGRMRPDLDIDVYESGDLSFMLVDLQTFTVAPTTLVDSLAAAMNYPALAPADLEPLLRESDRRRHMTLLFDVNNIDIHRESNLRPELQPLLDQMVVWLGKDIETVSWSMHLQPNLFMETLLRQSNESSALKVQRHMRLQLEKLPKRLLNLAKLMRPSTEGSQRMVGRFPAMMHAVSLATSVDVAGQYVRCVTLLPQKAAANLAAGSVLTWNQSVVTDFSTAVAVQSKNKLPDTVAERLEMSILVDFRNTPLQEVVGYIGDGIKTEFVINGDGLKNAGFTQNMPQSFDLGTISAKATLHAVLQKYAEERDPLVISVDEAAKRITLTTRSQAKVDGMAEFDTAP